MPSDVKLPWCWGLHRSPQSDAEHDCVSCPHDARCMTIAQNRHLVDPPERIVWCDLPEKRFRFSRMRPWFGCNRYVADGKGTVVLTWMWLLPATKENTAHD